jgi:hypothetical protein
MIEGEWGQGCRTCRVRERLSPFAESGISAQHDQPPHSNYMTDKSFAGIAVKVLACMLKRMERLFIVAV